MTGLKAALKGGAAKLMHYKGASELAPMPPQMVVPKAGPPGSAYRRLVRYECLGPFMREIEFKWVAGEAHPVMQKYWKHRFLHATKGWREYTGGEHMSLPRAVSLRPKRTRRSRAARTFNIDTAALFYGKGNHAWALKAA